MRSSLLAAVMFTLIVHGALFAFNPPVDQSGPLTARIEAPDSVTELETPIPFEVVLENSSDQPIEGTLRLKVIDRFRVTPAAPVPFAVGPKGVLKVPCTLVAGKGSYRALYPIHAYAEFAVAGVNHTVHPIKVFKAEVPEEEPTRTSRMPWRSVVLRDDAALSLCDNGMRRTVYRVFAEEAAEVSGVGGDLENPRHRGTCVPRSTAIGGKQRKAFFMHPPWKDGLTGTAVLEFPLALPDQTPIRLSFANAMNPDTLGDGVTFRVRVLPLEAVDGALGEIVFERHTTAQSWQEGEVDLSSFAGRSVRLQFESHPGPKNDTSWDHANWAEPVLVTGTPRPLVAPSAETLREGESLGTIRRGSREYDVRVRLGERGLLDAAVGFLGVDATVCFRDFQVRVLGELLSDRGSPSTVSVERLPGTRPGEIAIRHHVSHPAGEFDVTGRLRVEKDALWASFTLENAPRPEPWFHVYLEDTAVGEWETNPVRVYAGPGNVMVGVQRDCDLGFDGHRCSTSFVGFEFNNVAVVQGVDGPPLGLTVRPGKRHASLHAAHPVTFTFIPHDSAFEAAKAWRDVNGLEAAGGVRRAAGRFVFDLWGGDYQPSAQALEASFRYGLTDAMVVWHNWQRWGYDYRLPEITPPNPRFGSTEEMIELIETCRRRGVPFAPHDNYIDFYPDAEGFSYEKTIAFHENGRPVLAWLNEGRGAQSYRYRADTIERFLRPNVEWIRKNLRPTGYFIDVWASAGPYDYWTARGAFHASHETLRVWAESFAWIRDFLGDDAPMISESGHDQLIGYLDGAQTNHLRVGNPVPGNDYGWAVWDVDCEDAQRIPWFDIAHHDRFILHGAGYAPRYAAGLHQALHGLYSDDYVSTEILTGRPGMVSAPFGRDVVRKYWLTQDWSRAVAMRTIEHVEFVDGDIHRQYVRWSNGAEAWVNRGEDDWNIENRALPQYGFLAKAPLDGGGLEASIERLGKTIVERARTPKTLYVNGRLVVDGPARIRPVVESFRSAAGRAFTFDLLWNARTPIPKGYVPFLHFSNDKGEILFQGGQEPRTFVEDAQGDIRCRAHAAVPESLPLDRDFSFSVGLYRPDTGERLELDSLDDGSRRYRLGTVRLIQAADGETRVQWTPAALAENPAWERQNVTGEPVDFGPVQTAAGCRFETQTGTLVITPLPAEKGAGAVVRICPESLGWRLGELKTVRAVDIEGRVLGTRPVDTENGEITLTLEPGVFQYRLGK